MSSVAKTEARGDHPRWERHQFVGSQPYRRRVGHRAFGRPHGPGRTRPPPANAAPWERRRDGRRSGRRGRGTIPVESGAWFPRVPRVALGDPYRPLGSGLGTTPFRGLRPLLVCQARPGSRARDGGRLQDRAAGYWQYGGQRGQGDRGEPCTWGATMRPEILRRLRPARKDAKRSQPIGLMVQQRRPGERGLWAADRAV